MLILNFIINFSEYVAKHLAIEDFKKRDRLVTQVSSINSSGWVMLDKSRVFELYEQSDEESMTRTVQETGVGLYVVKKLCDKMNLSIDILTSENLGGARVVIRGKKELR